MNPKMNPMLQALAVLGFVMIMNRVTAADHGNLFIVCPPNSTATAPPMECGLPLNWELFNWQSSVALVDTIFEPSQGTFLDIGTSILTITGIDINGDTSSCSFTLTVVDAGANMPLICNDNISVILDENCQREITLQMMVESPNSIGCPELYDVQLFSPQGLPLGNVVDLSFANMPYTVVVRYEPEGSKCWGLVTIVTDSLPPSITCPADTVVLCNVPTLPAYVGAPVASGCFQLEDLLINYSDDVNNSFCDGDNIAYEIMRTWTAVDSFGNTTTCFHHITGVRPSLNDVVFPPDYNGFSHPFLVCNDSVATEALADTSITGRPVVAGFELDFFTLPCDFAVSFEDSIEQICGAHYLIKREWEIIDLCLLEEIRHTQTIEVVDLSAPVFDVVDTLHMSTLSVCSDTISLPPINFIYDCSPYSVEIWTPWDTINADGGSLVVPKMPDTVALLYVVTDACGNNDVGITMLAISDDLIVRCPPNTTISYEEYLNNYKSAVEQGNYSVLDPLGLPMVAENCEATIIQDVLVDVDSCGKGSMVRTFSVTASGISSSCQQEISLVHVSDFVVEFPADSTFYCSTSPLITGEPIIHNAANEHIQVSYTDQKFFAVPDACYKIFRNWKVVNTCVSGAETDQEVEELPESMLMLPYPACDLDGDGDCDDKTYRDSWTSTQNPGIAEASQQFGPDNDPDPNPWDGVILHTQIFKVIDEESPLFTNGCTSIEHTIYPPDCEATVTLPTPEIEECSDLTLTKKIKIGGQWHEGPGPYYGLGPGVYEVEYRAVDICNNLKQCNTTLTVIDPAPVAKCKTFIDVELALNTCTFTLFASDVDDGSTDNCPGQLSFSFSPQAGNLALTFKSCDVGSHNVKLYVIDKYKKVSSCNTTVNIQQPSGGACECLAGVQGIVKTETGAPVRFAQVIASSIGNYSDTVITDETGTFYFDLIPGQDINVSASKDLNPANGISTFDLVLITKHILNTELLDSPYKIIAADVNGSKSVTTFDVLIIRQLILQVIPELPVPSWKMIPESFEFPDPMNPWSTPIDSVLMFLNIDEVYTDQNFIGIKMGDVNNTADPLNLSGHGNEFRAAMDTLEFTALQKPLPGNRYEVSIYPESAEIVSLQFSLRYSTVQFHFDSLVPVFYANSSEFGWNNLEDYENVVISWFDPNTASVKHLSDVPLFKMYFSAKGNSSSSTPIVSRDYDGFTSAEVYLEDLIPVGLKLTTVFETPQPKQLEVEAPFPNPFNQRARISGQMPGSGNVTLHVYQSNGRTAALQRTFSKDGRFTFIVEADDIPMPGTYFYHIHSRYGNSSGWLIRQ